MAFVCATDLWRRLILDGARTLPDIECVVAVDAAGIAVARSDGTPGALALPAAWAPRLLRPHAWRPRSTGPKSFTEAGRRIGRTAAGDRRGGHVRHLFVSQW